MHKLTHLFILYYWNKDIEYKMWFLFSYRMYSYESKNTPKHHSFMIFGLFTACYKCLLVLKWNELNDACRNNRWSSGKIYHFGTPTIGKMYESKDRHETFYDLNKIENEQNYKYVGMIRLWSILDINYVR